MKKFLIALICFISFVPIVNASNIELRERNGSNNFGINKKNVRMNSDIKKDILNTPYVVNPNLNVYDFGDLLSAEDELYVRSAAKTLSASTNWAVVFYIISDSAVYSRETESKVATDFYLYNDFGMNNGKYYDGVVIVMNKLRTGSVDEYGYFDIIPIGNANNYLDYDRVQNILDQMETEFWSGNYRGACEEAVSYLSYYHEKGEWENDGSWVLDENGLIRYVPSIPSFLLFLVSFGISAIVCAIFIKRNKMVRKAFNATSYIDVNDRAFSRRQDIFKHSKTTSYTVNYNSGGRSGGRSGGGYSGGGGRRR